MSITTKTFSDRLVSFPYSSQYEVVPYYAAGLASYGINRVGRRRPLAVLQVLLYREDATHTRSLVEAPESGPAMAWRRVIRRGPVAIGPYTGVELLVQNNDAHGVASDWSVFLDAGQCWLYLTASLRSTADEAEWRSILVAIQVVRPQIGGA